MENKNNGQRFKVFTIALSTIGVLALIFTALLLAGFAFTLHTVSSSVQGIVAASTHKSSGVKVHYAVPSQHTPYIAGIKLTGPITDATADEIIDKLEMARQDQQAVGVLFEVSSPGGSVVPSQEIFDEIKAVRIIKPVVTYVREMAASGAYYSSASSTKIIANRGSLIGSIGVIMESFEADKLIQFLKINPVTIKTGALKDTGSPTRSMNEADKKYLQDLIEATRAQFAHDVQGARGLNEAALRFMSDGRVVLAPKALELKLVDEIGSKKLALASIATLAKQKKEPELFYYENTESLSELFSQKFSGEISQIFKISLAHFLTAKPNISLE